MRKNKLICAIVVTALLLSSGCTKGPVKTVESEISAIGYVTENSAAAIETARADYERLTEEEKGKVRNYQTLVDAEYDLDKMYASRVDKLIDDIKTIDDSTPGKIAEVEQAYNALNKDQQRLVNKIDKLDEIKAQYEEYVVDKLIELITSVKEKRRSVKEDTIIEINNIYAGLSDEQKEMLDAKLGESYQDAMEMVQAVICDYYIKQIDYISGAPSKQELSKLVDAAKVYYGLSDSAKSKVEEFKDYDKAVKEYSKYIKNRAKTDKLYARRLYIEQCEEIATSDIITYQSSYKGHLIKLTVEFGDETSSFTHTFNGTVQGSGDPLEIQDKRDKREPAITTGDTVTVYGKITGTKKIKEKDASSGWFNSSLFADVTNEYEIPCIEFVYTDIDNLGIIKSGDPNDKDVDVDEEYESMILEMNKYTEGY